MPTRRFTAALACLAVLCLLTTLIQAVDSTEPLRPLTPAEHIYHEKLAQTLLQQNFIISKDDDAHNHPANTRLTLTRTKVVTAPAETNIAERCRNVLREGRYTVLVPAEQLESASVKVGGPPAVRKRRKVSALPSTAPQLALLPTRYFDQGSHGYATYSPKLCTYRGGLERGALEVKCRRQPSTLPASFWDRVGWPTQDYSCTVTATFPLQRQAFTPNTPAVDNTVPIRNTGRQEAVPRDVARNCGIKFPCRLL